MSTIWRWFNSKYSGFDLRYSFLMLEDKSMIANGKGRVVSNPEQRTLCQTTILAALADPQSTADERRPHLVAFDA